MSNSNTLHPKDPSPATLRRSPAHRWARFFLLGACGLFGLVLLIALSAVLWLRSATKTALPMLDGELHLVGLSAPVTVERDAHGVPHIQAATQEDLFIAQGYVTAQDRLWQMDGMRRNADGELAEILGPSQVEHDKTQRVLRIRATAHRIYTNLSVADRARLDEYARGVNLFIAQHSDSLPPEFKVLFYLPRPWTGEDSVSVGLTMAQMLDTHWDVKLAREHIAAKLNNEKLENDLYPVGSWRDHPPTGILLDLSQPHPEPVEPKSDNDEDDRTQATCGGANSFGCTAPEKRRGEEIGAASDLKTIAVAGDLKSRSFDSAEERVAQDDRSFAELGAPSLRVLSSARLGKQESRPSLPHEDISALHARLGLAICSGCIPGSNNWVVSGSHTASGKPLLSNDMHLGLLAPNIWFMADLQAPGYHVAGVTIPGVPGIIAGHNEHVAWGITALYADVQDLYIEKLDGKGNYQANDTTWKPLQIDHEIIKVRGGKEVVLDVQSTEHGPLLNPIFSKETRPISLKWTIYDPTLNALPIYELDTASNWTEFSGALGAWCWPTLNFVYSDDQGHIAYQAAGRVPLPFLGNQVPFHRENLGSLQGTNQWVDDSLVPGSYLPFDHMPRAFDPPSGFLATANSRVTSDNAPIRLTMEWADPYRIERIYKLLQGRDQLRPKDMLAVQTDIYSEVDQEMGQRFAYAIDHTDGADERLKKAADLMRSWDGRLTIDSAAASLVTQARHALWPLILEPKLGKEAAEYRWSESNFAEEEIVMHANPIWLPRSYKNWDALLTDAVRKGMEAGKAPENVARWSYGSWHVVDIEHPLTSFLPHFLNPAGTGEQPQSGDTTTVKQVGRSFGPSQRFTMDWNNIDGSTENIVLGESGNPLSPYFSDQWKDWYGGTTFALPFTSGAVTAQARHTLRLVP